MAFVSKGQISSISLQTIQNPGSKQTKGPKQDSKNRL